MSPRDFMVALIMFFVISLTIFTFMSQEPSEDITSISEYSYYIPH